MFPRLFLRFSTVCEEDFPFALASFLLLKMASSAQQVDPRIWSACGGQLTLGPAMLRECVFIPQGLIGQCSNNEELRLFCSRLPAVACSVVSVEYLADTSTDEVYAKITVKHGTGRSNPAHDASRTTSTTDASNTRAAPAAPSPTTSMPASNTTAAPAPRPTTRRASNTRAPSASRAVVMDASNTRAPTPPRPTTTLHASNTTAAPAPRPTTTHASNTRAPSASRAVVMDASNVSSPAARGLSATHASNTRSPTPLRPTTTLHASNATAAPAPRPTTTLASITTSPATSRLTILPGFIKVIGTNDLISHECTITAASLGVDEVLPKEEVSLQIRDIHGRVWLFEHRYNHILESHSLANGWKPFSESKKLSSGDSLVFVKTEDGLTVGIRSAPRSISALFNMGEPLSRVGSGSLSVAQLAEVLGKSFCSIASGGNTMTFDYFPSVQHSWFVVPAGELREKIQLRWHVGMKARRFGMVTNQLRGVCIQGSVTGVRELWSRAYWKTLDIHWDQTYGEREAATNFWEIEPVLEETAEPVPER